MQYQRDAKRLEAAAGQLRPLSTGRRRQCTANNVREADTGALEQTATLEDARNPVTCELGIGGFLPHVTFEWFAVEPLACTDDALLQAAQVVGNGGAIGRLDRHERWRLIKASTVSYQATMLRGFMIQ